MTQEKKWQIVQQTTMGWFKSTDTNTQGLTKEQCKVRLDQLINEGISPKDLKAVPD